MCVCVFVCSLKIGCSIEIHPRYISPPLRIPPKYTLKVEKINLKMYIRELLRILPSQFYELNVIVVFLDKDRIMTDQVEIEDFCFKMLYKNCSFEQSKFFSGWIFKNSVIYSKLRPLPANSIDCLPLALI